MMFLKEFFKRIQDLILECISFKFLIFILILTSTGNQNIPYVSEIIGALSGVGVLTYKYYKDTTIVTGKQSIQKTGGEE